MSRGEPELEARENECRSEVMELCKGPACARLIRDISDNVL